MDWIKDHWAMLAGVGIVAVILVFAALAPDWPGADPERNHHAAACLAAGNAIQHHNHGGRDRSKTYWCVNSDGQITDLWFE
jgi:hypothetical protein